MRKNFYLYVILVGLISIVSYSCLKETVYDRSPDNVELSINEAKKFFENHYSQIVSRTENHGHGHQCGDPSCTEAHRKSKGGLLAPGNYTPGWNQAKRFKLAHTDVVVIDFQSEYKFLSAYYEYKGEKRTYRTVKCPQKLVVWQSRKSGYQDSYIATLIPTREYALSHKDHSKYSHLDPKCKYSGIAVHSSLSGTIIKFAEYKNGKQIRKVNMKDSRLTPKQRVDIANFIMQGRWFMKQHVVTSRSNDEGGSVYCEICQNHHGSICDPIIITYCNRCEMQGWCACCTECNSYICICCNRCFKSPCECPQPSCWNCYTNPCICSVTNCDDCGYYLCICCPLGCGSLNCFGECQNPPPPTPKSVAPNATRLLRNRNMTLANWQALEAMLAKIMANCVGGHLVNALDELLGDGTFSIQFIPGMNGGGGQFDGNGIILGGWESNTLFHELFHAYQAYNEIPGSYNGATLNLEIEARYAQYLYVSSLPEYTSGSVWADRYDNEQWGGVIQELARKSKKGASNTAIDDLFITASTALSSEISAYSSYPYNYDRIGYTNLSNFKRLSAGC